MNPDKGTSTFSISANDGTDWTDVPLPTTATVVATDAAVDYMGRVFLSANMQTFVLPPGSTTWQPLAGQTGPLSVVGKYVYVGAARSNDGGATFKPLASPALFADKLAPFAFAHRADPTFWLGDPAGIPAMPNVLRYGLIVGTAP